MRAHKLSGRMLNDYAFGGYLIWSAPEYKVFVDGRGDVYEWTGVLREYGSWATLQEDPTALLDKYHIELCLMPRTAPIARVLPYLHEWALIYSDDKAVLFQKRSAQLPR